MRLSEKIKASAIRDSHWLVNAKNRETNEHWLDISFKIAVKILKFIRENNLTQKELAERLDFSPQHLSKVLKGRENLTLETIIKIQNAINVVLIQVPDFSLEKIYDADLLQDAKLNPQIEKSGILFAYETPVRFGEPEEVRVSDYQYAMVS